MDYSFVIFIHGHSVANGSSSAPVPSVLLGAVNIRAAPQVLEALSPVEAVRRVREPGDCLRGDRRRLPRLDRRRGALCRHGHVGARAIRLAWFVLVLPALLLNYFGQGALVLTDPRRSQSVLSIGPAMGADSDGGVAAVATIIASQALISGVFADSAGDASLGSVRVCGSCRLRRRSRPNLRAGRQLAVDGRHVPGGRAVQELG